MGRKVGPELRPTSSTGSGNGLAAEHGFVLLEIVCVVAIIALLAAIILPIIPRATSHSRLEAYAFDVAALLKADRDVAIRRRVQVRTQIDARARVIGSGASGRQLRLPDDVIVEAMLASRCGDRPAGLAIVFFASGMSCGGVIAMARPGASYQVRVNWLTGGVEVVPIPIKPP